MDQGEVVGRPRIERGEIYWADLPEPRGSEPGFQRPVVILQADLFNRSRIRTVIVAAITSNLNLAAAPGNVLITGRTSGLRHDSVVNISQLFALDRMYLLDLIGRLPHSVMVRVDAGLRQVLGL